MQHTFQRQNNVLNVYKRVCIVAYLMDKLVGGGRQDGEDEV